VTHHPIRDEHDAEAIYLRLMTEAQETAMTQTRTAAIVATFEALGWDCEVWELPWEREAREQQARNEEERHVAAVRKAKR